MIDQHSPVWRSVSEKIETEIAAVHLQLEKPGLPIEQTEALRGEIRAYRKILMMAAPNKPIAPPPTDRRGTAAGY